MDVRVGYGEPGLATLVVKEFTGEMRSNVYHGTGTAVFTNGQVYRGDFDSGLLCGQGTMTWPDGTIYSGAFEDNTITGSGSYSWPDGSTYTGQVDHGLRHGKGIFHCSAGTYEGDWLDGKRHGKGSLQYRQAGTQNTERSAVYVGGFNNNKRHGEGKMVYASGNVYEGEWCDDMRHGRGTMTWHAQSEMYSGDWRNGIQHGHGEHTWFAKRFVATTFVQHNQYVGEFADGKRHGVGTFYYASGATYVGEWVSDKKHGEAVYTSETGVVFAGTFVNDRKDTPTANVSSSSSPAAVRVVKFVFNIDDLEPDAAKAEANLKEIDNILSRYITEIRECYNKYRTLGAPTNEHNTRVLTRLQFLRLIKDMDIEVLGLSTAHANRVIHPVRKSWSLHSPRDALLPRDLCEALIRVGWHVFRPTVDTQSPHPIADCFLKIVLRSLEYDTLKGYLFQNDQIAQRMIAHTAEFEQLYLKYAEAGVEGDHVLRWREVLFMARDVGVFADFADSSAVPQVVLSLSAKMTADNCTDMRHEVSLLELMEFFTGCAIMKQKDKVPTQATSDVVQLDVATENVEEAPTTDHAEARSTEDADNVPPRRRSSTTIKFQIRLSEHFDAGTLSTHASPFSAVNRDLDRVNELLALIL